MGLLTELRQANYRATASASDERFWNPYAATSNSGIAVNADTAMKASAVFACVRLISESVGAMPLLMYQRQADGGKRRAPNHPLYDLLHLEPSSEPRMTAFNFKSACTAHLLLRGNAYAYIRPGPRGPVDQLELIPDPDLVTPQIVDRRILRYSIRQPNGTAKVFNAEDIFHVTGLSMDGIIGMSVIKYARESIGLGLAGESYAARVFSQDGTPRGVLEMKGKLSQDGIDRLRAQWAERHAGLANAHKPAVLEEGMEWKAIGMTAEDAQLIASREFQTIDIARWFNVPLHMIQENSKATSWGSGIEQLSLGFVTYTLLPWLRRWEDTIAQQLIVANRVFFAEFLVDALLRGSLKDRYDAYAVGRANGWLTVNDILRLENLNPIGPEGDSRLEPVNTRPLGSPYAPPTVQSPSQNGHAAPLKELVHAHD